MHIESRDVKSARKNHWCDSCNGPIHKGDGYCRYTYVDCGEVQHAKQCEVCIAFAKANIDLAIEANKEGLMYTDFENYAEFAFDFAVNKLCEVKDERTKL